MRRVNKILMATVAILLCLVLISTSVVSGIFAKYVIVKDAQISAVIQKFGVKVYLDTSGAKAAGAVVNPSTNGDEASVSITGLNLKPGDNIYDALKIRFEGSTTVPLKVTIMFHSTVVLGNNQFRILATDGIGDIKDTVHIMPVGFKCGAENITFDDDGKESIEYIIDSRANATTSEGYVTNLAPYFHQAADNIELRLAQYLNSKLGVTILKYEYKDNNGNSKYDRHVYQEFEAGERIAFKGANTLVFGFEWPETYTTSITREITNADKTKKTVTYDEDTLNRVSAFLSQNDKDKTIPITFTVKIEQTGA